MRAPLIIFSLPSPRGGGTACHRPPHGPILSISSDPLVRCPPWAHQRALCGNGQSNRKCLGKVGLGMRIGAHRDPRGSGVRGGRSAQACWGFAPDGCPGPCLAPNSALRGRDGGAAGALGGCRAAGAARIPGLLGRLALGGRSCAREEREGGRDSSGRRRGPSPWCPWLPGPEACVWAGTVEPRAGERRAEGRAGAPTSHTHTPRRLGSGQGEGRQIRFRRLLASVTCPLDALHPTSLRLPVMAVGQAAGQVKSSQKIEGLVEMVKKMQKVGCLEPRVEVLINQINEVHQAKKKTNEELGEARTVWETLQKELDSLSGEKLRLKEILNKKQESLRILRLHCKEKEGEAQRKHIKLQGCKERISALNSKIEEEKNKQRQLRLEFEEQLEDLMSKHKDLWEFHRSERLMQEISTLDNSKEQLLEEEKLVEAKLEDVKHQLCSQFGTEGSSTMSEGIFLRSQEAAAVVHLLEEENQKAQELRQAAVQRHEQLHQKCHQLQLKRHRLKEELEMLGLQVPAQDQNKQEEANLAGAVSPGTGRQGPQISPQKS
ncbi:synaptonemal complex central element protein 1 [Suncus etruscus]|uniref:synaptonemal complex central element protein 1 n=1 Tax=Suncus etruscus TaxID=109475 RepID=UPI002110D0F5|nr:synaptonemal complex central element protein 1 [Suncus etruscus]